MSSFPEGRVGTGLCDSFICEIGTVRTFESHVPISHSVTTSMKKAFWNPDEAREAITYAFIYKDIPFHNLHISCRSYQHDLHNITSSQFICYNEDQIYKETLSPF